MPYYKKILILAKGTVFSHFIALLALPVLTRLYGPESFGVLTVYLSAAGLISVISAGKYELAILNPKNSREAYSIAVLALLILGVFVISGTGLAFLALRMGLFQDENGILFYVSVGVFLTMLFDILSFLNIREDHYAEIALTKVTRTFAASLVQIVLGVLRVGYIGLIMGEVVGRFSGNVRLFLAVKTRLLATFCEIRLRELITVARTYRHFPKYAAPSWFLNNSVIHLTPLFIAYHYGVENAGYYYLSYKIMSIPELILSQSVNQAFSGEFSKMVREKTGDSRALFLSTVKKLFLFSAIVSPALGLTLHVGFPYFFGGKWEYAGQLVIFLVPLFIAQLTMSSMYIALNILGQQKRQLFWDSARTLSLVLIVIATTWYGWDIFTFLSAYATIIVVSYYILFRLIQRSI